MAADAQADLASVAAFQGLDAGQLASLRASLEPFQAEPGDVLFRQNDAAEGMHVITRGKVRIQGRTLADGLTHLADIGPGEVVGEFGLVDQGRRSATAEVLEPTGGFFMPREQFERLLFIGDRAAFLLSRELRRLACSRTRWTVEAMGRDEAGERRARRPDERRQIRPRAADGTADMLAALHQFRGFKRTEAERLVAAGRVLDARRGAVLAETGAAADGIWIVLRGAVRTGLDRADGIEQLLIHGPGKIVGGVAAMDGLAQPARLDAREEAILLHIGQPRVEAWKAELEPAAARLAELISKQLVADLRALSRRQGRIRSMAVLNAAEGAADV